VRGIRVAVAFLRREFLEEISYPLKVVLGLVAVLLSLGFLVVFHDFIARNMVARGEGIEGGYFTFALVGLSFHSLLDTALRELSSRIRSAQMQGTFEAMLATRTPLSVLMVVLPLPPMLRTCVRFVVMLLIGWLVFDVQLRLGNWPVVMTGFALALIVFIALGLMFAGLTIVLKQTGPLITMFIALCFFFSGVIVPWEELPRALRVVSSVLPMTPALEAFRIAAVGGGGWSDTAPALWRLAAFAVVLVPLSLVTCRWSLRQALRDGSLGQY